MSIFVINWTKTTSLVEAVDPMFVPQKAPSGGDVVEGPSNTDKLSLEQSVDDSSSKSSAQTLSVCKYTIVQYDINNIEH